MARPRALLELTRVRVLLFFREPEVVFWVFLFPIVLAAILGWAFRGGGPRPSPVGVLAGEAGTALRAALERGEGIELVGFDDAEEGFDALRRGTIDALVEGGDPPRVRLHAERAEAETARLRVRLALAGGDAAALDVEPVVERGSRYVDFLFPGLIGMNVMGTGMWVIGFAVADLRQKKVLKRLLVTPMRRSTFLLSFLLARLVFLLLEVGVLALFGTLLLGVPFRAGLVSFAGLCLLGGFTFAGLGMLVTARARTIQGASGMLNLAMVPMWLFSGIFFSYERFPDALHPLLRALPLTSLNDALRALLLDGDGLLAVLPELGMQALWGALAFALALRLFRWH